MFARKWSRAVILAAIILNSACVTSQDPQAKKSNEAAILESKLEIVVNYLEKGLTQRAHNELRPLLSLYPRDARVQNLMGLTYLAYKKPQIAQRYFARAISLQADIAYTLNLSSALIDQAKYDRAIKILKTLPSEKVNSYPYPERIHHNLGFAHEKIAAWPVAVSHFEKALAVNPSYYPTILELAEGYARAKNLQKSQTFYEKAIEACQNCYAPVRALVLARIQEGKMSEATALLQNFQERKNIPAGDRERVDQDLARLKSPSHEMH